MKRNLEKTFEHDFQKMTNQEITGKKESIKMQKKSISYGKGKITTADNANENSKQSLIIAYSGFFVCAITLILLILIVLMAENR